MSAWDVAGALVWTFFGVTGWREYATTLPEPLRAGALVILIPMTLGSIFCIARLCGARA